MKTDDEKKDTAIKSYTSWLLPNDRKEKDMARSFLALDQGSRFFFDLMQAWYGGLTPDIIKSVTKERDLVDLWCAIYWFRPMKKELASHPIDRVDLAKTFQRYYGGPASDVVQEYLSASIGEDCCWNDCRQKYQEFCKNLGVDFTPDLKTLVREKLIAVASNDGSQAAISNLFGNGGKEDRNVKVNICKKILIALEKAGKSVKYVRDVQSIILKCANAKDREDFNRIYAGKNGRPSTLLLLLDRNGENTYDAEVLKRYLRKTIKSKNAPLVWNYNQKLFEYIERGIRNLLRRTINYDAWAWGEMWRVGHTPLQTKATRNYHFAQEQLKRHSDIAAASQSSHAIAVALNEFFESPFFDGENRFTICPHHLGKNLEKLFKAWADETDEEDAGETAIADYCAEFKDGFDREPIRNLLRYVYASLRSKYSAKELIQAAKYNQQFERYQRQKAHPVTPDNQGYTWPEAVIKPSKAERKNRENSLDTRIWVSVKLLQKDGTWGKHHIPFYNLRFFEEVYAAASIAEDMPSPTFRNSRFGFKLPKLLNTHAKINKKKKDGKKDKKAVNAAKREARIYLAAKEGRLPAPSVPLDKLSAVIARVNGKFQVTVPVKFKVNKQPKYPLPQLGQIILGYDQNLTANHAWALFEVVTEDTPGAHFCRNQYLRVLKTGQVRSITKTKDGQEIDQLSYDGLEYKEYGEWRKQAKKFASQWYITTKVRKGKETTLLSQPALERFESIEKYKPALYRFNKEYARLLLAVIRRKTLNELEEIRPEIFRLVEQGLGICRFGSLSLSSFEAIRAAKAVIHGYFSTALKHDHNTPITDDEREAFDPELFGLLNKLETLRQNKGEEKINRAANALIRIALENKADFIRGEGDLPTTNRSVKKGQNSRSMDWLARGLFNKICQLAVMHNIIPTAANPHSTSHQDPFEHNKDFDDPQPAMKCRYAEFKIEDIGDSVLERLGTSLRNAKAGQTGAYYYKGAQDFLAHYGLQDIEEELKKCRRGRKANMPCWELQKRLIQKLGSKDAVVYIPMRGGRIYLATHSVTTGAKPIIFNGEEVWVSNADEIAAVNIGLTIIPTSKKDEERPDRENDDKAIRKSVRRPRKSGERRSGDKMPATARKT